METLRKGDGNVVKCPSCKSTLRFQPRDVSRKAAGRDEDGDALYVFTVACPECHDVLSVTPNARIRQRIGECVDARDREDCDL